MIIDDELSNINKLNIYSYNKLRKMKRRLYHNRYDNIVEQLMNRDISGMRKGRIKINNDNYFYPDLFTLVLVSLVAWLVQVQVYACAT